MPSKLKEFLHKHPKLRDGVRELRWQLKRVPVIDRISIAFDTAYFKNAGDERPTSDDYDGAGTYVGAYLRFILARVRGDVLDVGCGHGYLTRHIAAAPDVRSVVGIDKVSDFLCVDPKIIYKTMNLPPVGDFPGTFDVVVASEFVEHIPEEAHEALLQKVAKALRVGGSYIGSTPHNPTRFKTFSGSRFHLREYSKPDLERLLARSFRDVTVTALPEHCLVWEAKQPRAI